MMKINKTSYVITSTGYIALVYLVITLSLPLLKNNSLRLKPDYLVYQLSIFHDPFHIICNR